MKLTDLLQKGWSKQAATAISATPATDDSKVAEIARIAVAKPETSATNSPVATPLAALDPDRWCYPHSDAMNGAEIDTFIARQDWFTSKGLPLLEAESLADKLVLRDRDADDRRLCLECAHLSGHWQISWRCENWQAAGVAHHSRDAHLPQELVCTLQRCQGFKEAALPQTLP
jgi:hypothetical protein